MINLYHALTECEAVETHDFTGTLGQFFDGQGVNWRDRSAQPVAVTVNQKPVTVNLWDKTRVTPADDVQVRLIPRGGVVNFIRKTDPIMNWLMKSITPKQNSGNTQSGQNLETASATGNVAKLNDVVPELAGRYIRYPDYLTPPRRYFAAPREQWLEFLLCIGPGQYQILPENVKIGETTFAALGADATYEIFQPGQSMAGHAAMDIWYSAPEVGSTSSGTAGLDIPTEYTGQSGGETSATGFSFNDKAITITEPTDGHWADGLKVGSRITSITLPLQYTVTNIGVGANARSQIAGNFKEVMPISVDDRISISLPLPSGAAVASMDIDANGDGWMILKNPVTGDYIDSIPNGPQTLSFTTFGISYYLVTAKSEKTISVQKYVGSPVPIPPSGWNGFANVLSTDAEIDADTSTFAGDWTGLYAATPKKETTTSTQLDFFFSNGLSEIDQESGDIEQHSVDIEIAYRDRLFGGDFTIVGRTFTAATPDAIGFTETINHPPMVPEFRVRRRGVGSAETNINEKIQWIGLKSYMMAKTSYPDWTTMFVRIRSGGNVAANSENKINVVATRILPRLRGDNTFNTPEPTNDISAFLFYIAQSIGYTEDDIDMDELHRLHDIWLTRGDTFNHVFDATTVKEAIASVLSAGMAEMTVERGMIRPVRDEPRTVFEQAYSPQNMTGPLKSAWQSKRHDDPDGVEVEYMDEDTWTKETVKCLLPGDIGAKLERLKVIGPTNRDYAWRLGMRYRRKLKYRKWTYTYSTEMDALNSRYLSYVPLIDNIEGYGKSCILVSITPSGGQALLQVTEPLVWQEGAQHVVAYRDPDGRLVGPFNASPGPSEYHILAPIPTPWPVVTLKHEPPHVYFGPQDKWTFPALVTAVTPSGKDAASVTAVNYDARVYADDNNLAPDE